MSDEQARRQALEEQQRKAKALAIMEHARAVVERCWVGRAPAKEKEHCALTAINLSANTVLGDVDERRGVAKLAKLLMLDEIDRIARRRHFYTIHEWNDCPDRTKEEVLAVFDTVINQLRSELPAIPEPTP